MLLLSDKIMLLVGQQVEHAACKNKISRQVLKKLNELYVANANVYSSKDNCLLEQDVVETVGFKMCHSFYVFFVCYQLR